MAFKNYRKETSERSDEANWAKKILIEKTGLFFDSIEGCNENKDNVVTHLMERARIDFSDEKSTDEEVLKEIINLETFCLCHSPCSGLQTLSRNLQSRAYP